MHACTDCGRHHRTLDTACPFCGKNRSLGKLGTALTVAFFPVVLGACYGQPYSDSLYEDLDTSLTPQDIDGDGHLSDEDCDEGDPDVNPDAEELCDDGIDNNCDGDVDEDECTVE